MTTYVSLKLFFMHSGEKWFTIEQWQNQGVAGVGRGHPRKNEKLL
jgi:hypothetical protein